MRLAVSGISWTLPDFSGFGWTSKKAESLYFRGLSAYIGLYWILKW
jgi:hypothetical protein